MVSWEGRGAVMVVDIMAVPVLTVVVGRGSGRGSRGPK